MVGHAIEISILLDCFLLSLWHEQNSAVVSVMEA
jgi:hypothetical protein